MSDTNEAQDSTQTGTPEATETAPLGTVAPAQAEAAPAQAEAAPAQAEAAPAQAEAAPAQAEAGAPETATETAAEAVPVGADDTAQTAAANEPAKSGALSAADASDARADGAAAGATDGSSTEGGAPSEGGEGTEGKSKRRRRRKKKKPGAEGDPTKPERIAPFQHMFADGATKRHAFSAGEVVAGRVAQVTDGAILVDLFGKAMAVLDRLEPEEVEAQPEPEPAAETKSAAPAAPEAEATPEEPKAPRSVVVAPSIGAAALSSSADSVPKADAESTDPTASSSTATEAATTDADPAADAPAADAPAADAPAADAPAADAPAADAPTADAPAADPALAASAAEDASPSPAGDSTEFSDEASAHEDVLSDPQLSETPSVAGNAPGADMPPLDLDPVGDLLSPMVGAIVRGRVSSVSESGHIALVNRAVDRVAAKAALFEAREQRRRVMGLVFGYNRGGFDVLALGVRLFCPVSGMSLNNVTDPTEFVGQKFEFSLPQRTGGSKGAKGLVVSRRSLLERQSRKARKARLKSLKVGDEIEGLVTQVREFGIFVDIGDGLEGLVHQSEIGWDRSIRPQDATIPGKTVKVKVVKIGEGERPQKPKGDADGKKPERSSKSRKKTRVGLSIKALLPDPWKEHAALLEEGTHHKGKVVSTTDFGAFIRVADGIEGLLHISELGKNLKHAKEALKDGEEVDVVVERVDPGQRRVSLSRLSAADLKAIAEGSLDLKNRPKNLRPGTMITVTVQKAEQQGLTIQVKGVIGKRGRGFVPSRELEEGVGDKRKAFPAGADIEVKIIGIDRDGSLKCSVKGKVRDEERKAVRDYKKETAKQGFGTFGDLLRAKLPDQK